MDKRLMDAGSWRGISLEEAMEHRAPVSTPKTPDRAKMLSPVPEDTSTRHLDLGPSPVADAPVGAVGDNADALSDDSRTSSATGVSVASLGSIVSRDELVTVRVRDRKSGRVREYLVPRGTDVKDVVAKYALDSGKSVAKHKVKYRSSATSRLGHRYKDDLGALGRGAPRNSSAARPSAAKGLDFEYDEVLRSRAWGAPQAGTPPPAGLLGTIAGYGHKVLFALGSRGERPT